MRGPHAEGTAALPDGGCHPGGRIKRATILVGMTNSLGPFRRVIWWALTTTLSAPHVPLAG